jgi:hypothetical protein
MLGCTGQVRTPSEHVARPRVVVVAPVLNLSGSRDFDPLVITDLVASEFSSAGHVSVIPVNRVLAELASHGKAAVESPAEAVALAHLFHADAAVVVAVTEYDPYDPPVVGLIVQWYAAEDGPATAASDTVTPGPGGAAELSATDGQTPRWQIQRVFDASDGRVVKEIQKFAGRRDAQSSPYGWRRWIKSQELYVRFCSAALIETINGLEADRRESEQSYEAGS